MQSHTKNCPAHNGRLHPDFYHADHYRVTSRSFVPKNYRRSLCIVTAQHKDQSWLHGKWKDWSLERWAMSFLASAILLTNPMPSLAVIEQEKSLDPDVPVLDLAKVIPAGQEEKLIERLQDLEGRGGWKLRVLTRNGPKQGPLGEEVKRAWKYDKNTGIVICDPTSPNILQFQVGDGVGRLLSRGFFIELQSRYGNQFYVRDEGEANAILESIKAMTTCLDSGGCAVVPGLPENQYQLTLLTSIVGGFVFGYSTTIQPQGFVRRRFIWPLLFAPLWGTFFISFGIGPIVTRTQDRLPLLQNFAAFLIAAGIFRLSPLFKGEVDLDIISKEGQKKREAEDKDGF